MKPMNFILAVAAIFLWQQAVPFFGGWPVFVFPVFAIFLALRSKNLATWLEPVAAASLVFDFFSGLKFGVFTAAILTAYLTIWWAKKLLNVDAKTKLYLVLLSTLFMLEFSLLLSFEISLKFLIAQLPVLTLGSALVAALFLVFESAISSLRSKF